MHLRVIRNKSIKRNTIQWKFTELVELGKKWRILLFSEIAPISCISYLEKNGRTHEQIWTHALCFKPEGPGDV